MKTHIFVFTVNVFLHFLKRNTYFSATFKLWKVDAHILSFSLETSPITDSDTAKRTVFQRSYSVVASEYDKQHSPSPARVKAVPRRRVHSGDAGSAMRPSEKWIMIFKDNWCFLSNTNLLCPPYRSGIFPTKAPLSWAIQADLSPRLPQ